MSNDTSYFWPADGNWKMQKKLIKASTVIAEGAAVTEEISSNTTTGYYTLMTTTENTTGADFVGIMAEPIAATDSDYASITKRKGIYFPLTKNAVAYFAVAAGTFTFIDVGKTVEINATGLGLSVDTKGKGARIVQYISSTRGKCTFSLPETETA